MSCKIFRAFHKFIGIFKEHLEEYVLYSPQGRETYYLWILIAILQICAYFFVLRLPRFATFDIFFISIFAAVLCFKLRGLRTFISALALYSLGVYQLFGDKSIDYFISGLIEALEWFCVSLFVIFTIRRYILSKYYTEMVKRDVDIARTLQTALIPKDYDMGKVRINGAIRQCKEIGGDYYYFRPFQSHYVVFCLGDVMGKGIPASMVMSIIMGFIFEWGKKSCSPSEILSRLNHRMVSHLSGDMLYFTTIFYAVYDELNGELTYASGGHHDVILLHKDGSIEMLNTLGLLVGFMDGMSWQEKSVKMVPGDRVIAFTDGVTEACGVNEEMFTLERACEIIRSSYKLDNKGIIDNLLDALGKFTCGFFNDDVAILVVEVKEDVDV